MNPTTRRTAAVLLAGLAPVAVVTTRLLLGDALPDPLPTHWNLTGDVDGTTSGGVLLVATLLPSTVLAALAATLLARRTLLVGQRAQAVALVWAAWLAGSIWVLTASLSAGAARATDVALPWWGVLALPAAPTLAAAAVAALVRASAPERPPTPSPGSRLTLGAGERATWVGAASSRPLAWSAGGLLLVAAVVAASSWPPALAVATCGVAVLWVHAVVVRVDDRGLSVAWGPLGWPHTRVPLADITAATVEEIVPAAWGGWGYRMTPRASAAVCRRGPGLVLDRRSGRRFAVTVDRPEQGAELLHALLERRARTVPGA